MKSSVSHGAGGEFENRISNNAKAELRACTEILDHASLKMINQTQRVSSKIENVLKYRVENVVELASMLQNTIVTINAFQL